MGVIYTYIVGSGEGFFCQFINDTPELVSDPVCGKRMSENRALRVKARMEEFGFSARLIIVKRVLLGKCNG